MLRIVSVSLFAMIVLIAVFADIATAASAKKNPATVATNIQLIQHLEAIRANLNKADHDYKGHRAAAVHEITHAIHHLQHGKQHSNPGQHFTAGTHKEPQAVSDARLKQSLAALQSLPVPPGKHHAHTQTALKVG